MTLEDEERALNETIDRMRDRISALIDGVDPNLVIHQASGWRLRDLLAHIAAWEQEVVAAGKAHIAGEPEIPRQNIPRFNEKAYEKWKGMADQQVHAAWLAVYDDLKDVVLRAPADRWEVAFVNSWGADGTLPQHVHAILAHDAEHVDEIRRALGEASQAVKRGDDPQDTPS
jgi:hypothetical protein